VKDEHIIDLTKENKGHRKERYVVEAIDKLRENKINADDEQEENEFSWIKSAEQVRPRSRLDMMGVDIIVRTDIGRLYLQIKSSNFGRNEFIKKRSRKSDKDSVPVKIIVLPYGLSIQDFEMKVADGLRKARKKKLRRIREKERKQKERGKNDAEKTTRVNKTWAKNK
jgi:hypothetical protein